MMHHGSSNTSNCNIQRMVEVVADSGEGNPAGHGEGGHLDPAAQDSRHLNEGPKSLYEEPHSLHLVQRQVHYPELEVDNEEDCNVERARCVS